ncbi:hypothetical protein [Streptomyces sp. Root1310]|uniref:hypothetical protein n=1 Tax=Streptomyces sp. Root1310 TaxID=1736452 RepID=UPI0012FE99F2|nr:hypothetical protein [Streptomyces sp. Root1310]
MQRADLRVYPDDVPHEGLPGDLVGAADYIAGAVQRPAITRPPIMNGTDTVSVQLTGSPSPTPPTPRRWSHTNPRQRSTPFAAAWLLDRVEDAPGPFRKLTGSQADEIARTAGRAARALEMTRQTQALERPCRHCRGVLRIEAATAQPRPSDAVAAGGSGRAAVDPIKESEVDPNSFRSRSQHPLQPRYSSR